MEAAWIRLMDWSPVTAPGTPPLDKNQIHIWRLVHDSHRETGPGFRRLLSANELSRADRIIHPVARETFILTRGVLRTLIGGYLDMAPTGVQLAANPSGKPYITPVSVEEPFQFNTSHTRGVSLIIFSRACPVGIDVEEINPSMDYQSILQDYFSATEIRATASLNEDEQRTVFFSLWTRKEALSKAVGTGVASGLLGQDVWGSGRLPDAELSIRLEEISWRVWSFIPMPGFFAAAAVRESEGTVRYLDFCNQ